MLLDSVAMAGGSEVQATAPAKVRTPRTARGKRRAAGRSIERQRREAPHRPYAEARAEIQTGDVLLYRGRSLFSKVIRWASGSVYSHAAIAAWWGSRLVVLESTMSGGVAVRPASLSVEKYDGQVDWWVLHETHAEQLDRQRLIQLAIGELGKPYGRFGAFLLGIKLLFGRITGGRDAVSLPESLFCSQYVSQCYRSSGVDLVPNAIDGLTSPGAIARSGRMKLEAVLRRAPP
jgi:hypothetical protein